MNNPTTQLVRLCALVVLLLGLTSGAAWAQTFYVAPEATGTGASPADPGSLDDAIEAVNTGAATTISYEPGEYEAGQDFTRNVEITNDVTFEITGGVVVCNVLGEDDCEVVWEDAALIQIGDVEPDRTNPFDDTAVTITLADAFRWVLDGAGEVRFAFTDPDGDGTDPTNDTPSQIIGDGVLAIETDGTTRLAVDQGPGRAVIENLEITDNSSGTVVFLDRELEQFISEQPAALHIFGSLNVLGGTLDIGNQDLLVSLDTDDQDVDFVDADWTIDADAEILGDNGNVYFVLVDTDGADENPFSTTGTGVLNADFIFPYSQAEDANGDNDFDDSDDASNAFDVVVTFSAFGQDNSIIGGTVPDNMQDYVTDAFGSFTAESAENDPKVRFPNLTLVNGDLEIMGDTPLLANFGGIGLDSNVYTTIEDLDDDGTAVYFELGGTLTGEYDLESGAHTLGGAWIFEEDVFLQDGTFRLLHDGVPADQTVFTEFQGTFSTDDDDTMDAGEEAVILLTHGNTKGTAVEEVHNLRVFGDIDFDEESPIFSFEEPGAPTDPSTEPIRPVEDCGTAIDDTIVSNIGAEGTNVTNQVHLAGDEDQDIFLVEDVIIRRLVIDKSGTDDVEIDDDSTGNLVIAASQLQIDGAGDVVDAFADPDASSFLFVANADLVTNGRLDANGTGQVTIRWTADGRGIIDAGDADRAYVSDDVGDIPYKNRYEGTVGIFTGDELAGNAEGRTVDVDLDGDGQDDDVIRLNILQVALEDADLDNPVDTPVLTVGKDIAITCNLDLFESNLDPGSAQIFLANNLLLSVRDGMITRRGNPPFQGELVFPAEMAPGGFGVSDLILGDAFAPSIDGIDLYYYSTTDRTTGLEFPTEFETDFDTIRDLTVNLCLRDGCTSNQNGPTIFLRRSTGDVDQDDTDPAGDEEERFRVNRHIDALDGVLDINGRTLEIDANSNVTTHVFIDSDAGITDGFFYDTVVSPEKMETTALQLAKITAGQKGGEMSQAKADALTASLVAFNAERQSASKADEHGNIGEMLYIGNGQTNFIVNTVLSRLVFEVPGQSVNRTGSGNRRVVYDSRADVDDDPSSGNELTEPFVDTITILDELHMVFLNVTEANDGASETAYDALGGGVVFCAGLDVVELFGSHNQAEGEVSLACNSLEVTLPPEEDAAATKTETHLTGASDFTPDGGFWYFTYIVGSQGETDPDFSDVLSAGNHIQTDGEFYGRGGDEINFGDFQLGFTDATSDALWSGTPNTYHYQYGNFYVGDDTEQSPGFYLGSPCVVTGVPDCGDSANNNNGVRRNWYIQGDNILFFEDGDIADSGTLIMLGPDYQMRGTGDLFQDSFVNGSFQGFQGLVIFGGAFIQTVYHDQDEDAMFNNVLISNTSEGIEILSDMWLNRYQWSSGLGGTLNLEVGNVNSPQTFGEDSEEFEVIILNPLFECAFGVPRLDCLAGSNTVPDQFLYGIGDGARDSYVAKDIPIRRAISQGQSTGGDVHFGYVFPHGLEAEPTQSLPQGREFYVPIILQFANDEGQGVYARSQILTNEDLAAQGITLEQPNFRTDRGLGTDSNAEVIEDGLLINAVAPFAYKVEFFSSALQETPLADDPNADLPGEDPNIRIEADGVVGLGVKNMRILHYTCEGDLLGLAGVYDLAFDDVDDSFNENDFINGVKNLFQEGVNVRQCNLFVVAANRFENPVDLPLGSSTFTEGFAAVQFVHEASDQGAVDVYADIDGDGTLEDNEFITLEFADDADATPKATPFVNLPSNDDVLVEVRAAGSTSVLFSATLDFDQDDQSIIFVTDNGLVEVDGAQLSADGDDLDVLFAHTSDNAPDVVDIRTLDPFNQNAPNAILANNLEYGDFTGYRTMEPGEYTIEVSTGDNATVSGAFFFEFGDLDGQAIACFVTDTDLGKQGPVGVLCVDVAGNIIAPDVVTDTEEAELPTEFALNGNYPNPFNPSTTIQFDLPATAEVTVEIVDMLGRRVMTVPVQTIQAGADRALELNASNLASGVYVYRVTAKMANDTLTKTGRMTLIK